MKITRALIESLRTPRGGWKRDLEHLADMGTPAETVGPNPPYAKSEDLK
jgi:hypothetical protein